MGRGGDRYQPYGRSEMGGRGRGRQDFHERRPLADSYSDPYARDPYPARERDSFYARDPYARDEFARDSYPARDPYAADPYARDPYPARETYPPASRDLYARDSYPAREPAARDPYARPSADYYGAARQGAPAPRPLVPR